MPIINDQKVHRKNRRHILVHLVSQELMMTSKPSATPYNGLIISNRFFRWERGCPSRRWPGVNTTLLGYKTRKFMDTNVVEVYLFQNL